jgi:hypothetical protein
MVDVGVAIGDGGLGVAWASVGDTRGSSVALRGAVLGTVVMSGETACDWQAANTNQTAAYRKKVKILDNFFFTRFPPQHHIKYTGRSGMSQRTVCGSSQELLALLILGSVYSLKFNQGSAKFPRSFSN